MLWDEAANGVRFGMLCEMAATYDDPDGAAARAAGYLQGWIASGLLTSAVPAMPAAGRPTPGGASGTPAIRNGFRRGCVPRLQ